MQKLGTGDKVTFDPALTSDIGGLAQVYERLEDDNYLTAWDEARRDEVATKGDPRSRLQQIRDYFRARQYVRDLVTDQRAQVVVFSIAAVPGGSTTGTYSVERSGEAGASLKIVGTGGGAGFKTVMTTSFSFDAPEPGRMSSLACNVLLTAHLFDHNGRDEVIVDVRRADDAFVNVLSDVPALAPGAAGRLVYSLTQAGNSGTATYTHHAGKSYAWDVDLGIDATLFGVPIEAGLSYQATHTNGVEVAYKLPNGFDYYAYDWPGAGSLVPHLSRNSTS